MNDGFHNPISFGVCLEWMLHLHSAKQIDAMQFWNLYDAMMLWCCCVTFQRHNTQIYTIRPDSFAHKIELQCSALHWHISVCHSCGNKFHLTEMFTKNDALEMECNCEYANHGNANYVLFIFAHAHSRSDRQTDRQTINIIAIWDWFGANRFQCSIIHFVIILLDMMWLFHKERSHMSMLHAERKTQ